MAKNRAGRKDLPKKQDQVSLGETYFLGIGINKYSHWQSLHNAVRDVEAIADLLVSSYGLKRDNSHLLLDEDATEDRIIHQLEEMADIVGGVDSLVIYYAGHGHLNSRERGFWVPVDAPKNKVTRLIRNSTIRDYIKDIPSLHTLLVSDSCFSGSLFVRGQRSDDLDAAELLKLPSRWAISSGRQEELVADGNPGEHSPFAQSILDVLGNTDRSMITAGFLYEEVRKQTRANYQQNPDGGALANVGHKRGQFVFRKVKVVDEDGEKIEEIRAEMEEVILLLQKKHHNKARRRYEVLKKEAEEELNNGPRQDKLIAELSRLIQFCRLFPVHLPLYEQILLEPTVLGKEQLQATIDRLSLELAETQKLAEARQDELGALTQQIKELAKVKAAFQQKEKELAKRNKEIAQLKQSAASPPAEKKSQSTKDGFIYIIGGSFIMGDVMGDKEFDDEILHEVQLSDFYLSPHPVTFAEYDLFCEATGQGQPKDEGWGRGQHPVINVSWFDAIAYCNWLSKQVGYQSVYIIDGKQVGADFQANGYRLPTEAEWEYAARQRGEKLRFGNGKNIADPAEINFNSKKDYQKEYSKVGTYRGKTISVGGLKCPNALGLHDMSGNVWEWCWDWYGDYDTAIQQNPLGPSSGDNRVLRGGGWHDRPQFCRAAGRNFHRPALRLNSVGFRLARS